MPRPGRPLGPGPSAARTLSGRGRSADGDGEVAVGLAASGDRRVREERHPDAQPAGLRTVIAGPGMQRLRGQPPLGGADLPAGAEADERLAVRWLGARRQFGELRGWFPGPVAGDGPAPLEGAVAVVAHLAPVDAEDGPGPATAAGASRTPCSRAPWPTHGPRERRRSRVTRWTTRASGST